MTFICQVQQCVCVILFRLLPVARVAIKSSTPAQTGEETAETGYWILEGQGGSGGGLAYQFALIAVIVHSHRGRRSSERVLPILESSAYKHLMIMLGHVHGPLKHLNMLSPGSHLHMNKPLKMTDGPTHTIPTPRTHILRGCRGDWKTAPSGHRRKDKRKSPNYLPDPSPLFVVHTYICVFGCKNIFACRKMKCKCLLAAEILSSQVARLHPPTDPKIPQKTPK